MHRQFSEDNARIIENIRRARHVISVSDWVADILRRDLHTQPMVIPGHGLDLSRWDRIESWRDSGPPYALWNKTALRSTWLPQRRHLAVGLWRLWLPSVGSWGFIGVRPRMCWGL
jgi:hypothetical protein